MKKFEHIIFKILTITGIVLMMISCHKDSIDEFNTPNETDIIHRVESFLFGRISDGQMNPVSATVNVKINELRRTSNVLGVFDSGKITMNRDGQCVKILSEDYTPHYCWIHPELGETNFIDVELKDYKLTGQSSLNEDFELGSFYITYDDETLMNDGNIYKGNHVEFELHDVLAPNLENHTQLPMPDFTISEGETKELEMVELFYLKIRGDHNDQLDIAQNHGIVLDKKVSSYSSNLEGNQVYFWDEVRDQWIRGADFIQRDDKVSYWIDRPGWWCVAKEVPVVKRKIQLTLNGNDLAFQKLVLINEGSEFQKIIFTNGKGEAEIYLDPREVYALKCVGICGETLLSDIFEVTQEETYTYALYDTEDQLETSTFNCDDEPINEVLFLLKNNDRYFPIKPNSDGKIVMHLPSCHEGEFVRLEDVSGDQNYFLSKTLISAGNQDSIWICNDREVRGEILRGQQTFLIDSTLRAEIDTTHLVIRLSYLFLGSVEQFVITDISSDSIQGYAQGLLLNSDKGNHSIRFNIHQITDEGGLFIADFEGDVNIAQSSQVERISGSLVARIDVLK